MRQAQGQASILLGLVLLTCAIYFPTLSNTFIWDDDTYVIATQQLNGLSGLGRIWFDPSATPQYYPLVHTTFWLERAAWGLHPTGYHVVNMVLHALNAALLYLLLMRLRLPGALLAAAIFAVHPIQVETVAWVTERKNVLSLMMYLLAALCYLRFMDRRQWGMYALSLVCYIGALFSKTVAASLPAALLLVMWAQNNRQSRDGLINEIRRIGWHNALPLLPMFAVGLVLSLLTIRLEIKSVGASGAAWDHSFIERCLIAGRVAWFYARKIVFPDQFCFNYPRWTIDAGIWWQYLFPVAWLVIIALLYTCRKQIRRWWLAGVLFYLGTLLPASGFFDVYPMRFSFVADHFSYHAGIGVIVLASALIASAIRRWQVIKKRNDQTLLGVAAGILVLGLGAHSWYYAHAYHDEQTLWLDTLRKNPKSWMAHNYLGRVYEREYDYRNRDPKLLELAANHYWQGLQLHDQFAQLYANLGSVLIKTNQYRDAEPHLRRAVELQPDLPQGYFHLGQSLEAQGKSAEAMKAYEKAVELWPAYVSAHHRLATLLVAAGDTDRAISHFETCIKLRPNHPAPHIELSRLYLMLNEPEQAHKHLLEAEKKLPDHPLIAELKKRLDETTKP